jgi:3-oxoacyl-[acyl-carrier-protein] synthase-3
MTRGSIPPGIEATPGVRLVVAEMEKNAHDPFDGGVQRRVVDPEMTSTEMERRAGQQALEDAGIDPKLIDVLLVQSVVPDYLATNNASAVHRELGLREDSFALETQGVCNGFLLQLQIADQMLRSGKSRYALLIQCSPVSRLMDEAEPFSVWFGDGAAAVVLGPVSDGHGILSLTTHVDGSCRRSLAATTDEKERWYNGGKARIRALDPMTGRRMLLQSADMGKQVVDEVARAANVDLKDVGFFACHQASSWFRTAAQKTIGLEHARTVDTYSWAGNLASANLPLVMQVATKEKLINDGDLVAMYAGGGGMTWSAGMMRWGK